jgi:parallel beta-helix repeat protein
MVASSAKPSITGNAFTGNRSWAIWLEDADSTCGTLSGNSASGNVPDAIRVAGSLDCSTTWENAMVWVLEPGPFDVAAGRTLTLEPGTVIKSQIGGSSRVSVSGTLLAQGSAPSPIVFTSVRDDTAGGDTNGDGASTSPAPGDWGGLGLAATSAGSVLGRIEVRYGGLFDWWYGQKAGLHIGSSSTTVTDSVVASSSTQGIVLRTGVAPTITDNALVDNLGWAIWLEDPDSTGGTMHGNSAALTRFELRVNSTAPRSGRSSCPTCSRARSP